LAEVFDKSLLTMNFLGYSIQPAGEAAAAESHPSGRFRGMQNACSYGFGKMVELDYERALDKLLGLLRARDFNILFQVDMQEALRQETGTGFRRYMIIGACPQTLARRAFNADSNIGLLLPCNVVVYEEEGDRSRVMAMDPAHVMDLVRAPEVIEAAIEIKEELEALVEMM
jgi:uncharacterized protein (DUF302 family)